MAFVLLVGKVAPFNDEGNVVPQAEPFGQNDQFLLAQHQLFRHLRRGFDHGLSDESRLGYNPHPDHIVREAGDVLKGVFDRWDRPGHDKGADAVLFLNQTLWRPDRRSPAGPCCD